MYPLKEERRVSIRTVTHAARKWRYVPEALCAHSCCSNHPLSARKEASRKLSETRVAIEPCGAKICVEFRNLHRLGTSIVQRLVRKADLSHSQLASAFGFFNARRGVLHVLPA